MTETTDKNLVKTVLTHFIGMNGTSGCMPDSCNAYAERKGAVESLSELLELDAEQTAELESTGYTRCTQEQGADYAEITECHCPTPWDHSDGY